MNVVIIVVKRVKIVGLGKNVLAQRHESVVNVPAAHAVVVHLQVVVVKHAPYAKNAHAMMIAKPVNQIVKNAGAAPLMVAPVQFAPYAGVV
jgi:hypothetical protein